MKSSPVINLSPHALRRFLATGKVLHVEPMEPQPDWDSTGGCAYPGGRAMGGVYFRSEEEFARDVARHKELATVIPYRVGDRVEMPPSDHCAICHGRGRMFVPAPRKPLSVLRCDDWPITMPSSPQQVPCLCMSATITDVKAKRVADMIFSKREAAGMNVVNVHPRDLWNDTHPDYPYDTAWAWLTWLVKPDVTTKPNREE